MRRPALLLAALLPGLLAGCETSVEVETPPFEPRLVMYSFPSPDSVWSATLSETIPFGRFPSVPEWGPEATVVVRDGAAVVDTLDYAAVQTDGAFGRNGAVYVSRNRRTPEVGRTYTVEASVPGFESVAGTDTVPLRPAASLNAAERTPGAPGRGAWTVRTALADPPGPDTYELALLGQATFPDFTTPRFLESYRSRAPSLRASYGLLDVDVSIEDERFFYQPAPFQDRLFDGRRHAITIETRVPIDETADYAYWVAVARVTDAYRRYHASVYRQAQNRDNPFAEPSPLYSNVEGGHGVVAGYATTLVALPPLD